MLSRVRNALRRVLARNRVAGPEILRPFKKEDSERSAFQPGSTIVLKRDLRIIQEINVRPFELTTLAIQFATFTRINNCNITLRVQSESGVELFRREVCADLLEDFGFYSLPFESGFSHLGRVYLSLSSSDASDNNCVALLAIADESSDGLYSAPVGEDMPQCPGTSPSCLLHSGISLSLKVGSRRGQYAPLSYLQAKSDRYLAIDSTALEKTNWAFYDVEIDDPKYSDLFFDSQLPHVVRLLMDELAVLRTSKAVFVPAQFQRHELQPLIRAARANSVPVIGVLSNEAEISARDTLLWPSYLDGILMGDLGIETQLAQIVAGSDLQKALLDFCELFAKRKLPRVSIVTILSGKAEQLKFVIGSYFRQNYLGEVEVIYVDDCFGDAVAIIDAEFKENAKQYPEAKVSYRVIRNEKNLGNCVSRNRGIKAASGEIIVIIDADCMLNTTFVSGHVAAHARPDCDVVIGPHNIETNGAPPIEKMRELEDGKVVPLSASELQDPQYLESFLNCITRNFSIKKGAVIEELFDPEFSYSLAPDSGFGWEDVEMGYRLYKRGVRIKFTEDAFSVHISHVSSTSELEKPKKSIRNFRKLFVKHPELKDVSRRWAIRTFDALHMWSAEVDPTHHENQDLAFLGKLFSTFPRPSSQVPRHKKKLRILTYRWHVPHQYELYKSGHDFFLVKGAGTPMCDDWEFGQRPLPLNASFIDVKDIREADFDLALLHFDENVLSYENTNGKLGPDWGATFRYFVEEISLPKVAICHGTPQFYGQYTPGYDKPDLMSVIEPARQALVDYVREIEIVCNSYQAQREWKFHKSRVIWHGFDPCEFRPATYRKGILSPQGPLVSSRPHYRGYYLYKEVFSDRFPSQHLPETLYVPEPDINYVDNVYAMAKYRNYVDQIRQYSVYFNPTLRSPMPRARCEPMMCGVVTVNANNHDVEMFIRNGVNGFYSNDSDELREQLIYLCNNPRATEKIGERARITALDVFNYDRYLADWSVVFKSSA